MNYLTDSDFPPLTTSSLSSSKKMKRQENKAKKLHAYYELLKEKQPTATFDSNQKLPKPPSNSAHLKPRFIIETDDLNRPLGGQGVSQSVRLRSTLHSLGVLHPVGAEAQREAQKKRQDRKSPVIHPFDVQRLVLRALLGNDYKPRWCKLKNQWKLAKVVCVVVEGVAASDWYRLKDSHPNLLKLAGKEGGPVELHPSSYSDAERLRHLLHSVPLTLSDLSQFGDDETNDSKGDGHDEGGRVASGDDVNNGDVTNGDANADDDPRPDGTCTSKPSWRHRLVARTRASDAARAMETDGVVTWVDPTRHSDVFNRAFLLLNADEMIADHVPTPYAVPITNVEGDVEAGYWTLGGGETGRDDHCSGSDYPFYRPVTARSPLFAVDVEMCRAADGSFIPVWIAVVDERLRCIYDSLIRPYRPIHDYLTQFSGVSKSTLKGVTTTIADVARDLRRLLPGDAVLVGHQIGCDLESLRLVHPYLIDTVKILNLKGDAELKSKLRDLTKHLLARNIQEFSSASGAGMEERENSSSSRGHGDAATPKNSSDFSSSSFSPHSPIVATSKKCGHNPVEDATATMELVLLKLRNHPLFGHLGYPPGVVPAEWQTMPVKFLAWYEGIAKKQRAMRSDTNGVREEMTTRSVASPETPTTEAAVEANGATAGALPDDPSTPASSMKRFLSIDDEASPRSKLARASLPPESRWSLDQTASRGIHDDDDQAAEERRLTLSGAFRSTREIFPTSPVEDRLAQEGKTATRFTVRSEGECTVDRIRDGYFTTFVVVSEQGQQQQGQQRQRGDPSDLMRRADKCVGKIREFLPGFTLLTVAFSGRTSTMVERKGDGSAPSFENGIVVVDIV